MNGTFSWKSSIVLMSSMVTPASPQTSLINAERSYAQGRRSPSSFSSRSRSIWSRGLVSISGEKYRRAGSPTAGTVVGVVVTGRRYPEVVMSVTETGLTAENYLSRDFPPRTQLIDGEVVLVNEPRFRHQRVALHLVAALDLWSRGEGTGEA